MMYAVSSPWPRPTRATGNGEAHQGQPDQKPADHVLTNTPEAAPSDDSAFGIKVLVPGEAASDSEHQQGGTLVDETINHRCRCPFCLFLEDEGRNTRSPVVKMPELRICALEGCLICRTVSAAFFAFPNTSQDAISIELFKSAGLRIAGFINDSLAPLNRQYIASIDLFTLLGTPPILAAIKPRRRIHVNPLSKHCLSVAQEWIGSCVTEHHECTSEQTALPKRLLSVGTIETDEIKLVSVEHPVTYAALGYCWGDSARFETTAANKTSRMRAIEMSSLPRTFRDVVTVTRCLGMKHIWIDALCIIQDDPLDLEEECSKMGAIFSGCKLAIIAAQAQDSNAGFLTRSTSDRCVIMAKYRDQPVEIYARENIPHNCWHSNIPYQLSDCPVYGRGWCFQEMLLAPRSLHFGPREMVFHCRYEEKCECTGSEHQFSLITKNANLLYTPSLGNPGLHPISTDCSHLALRSRDQPSPKNRYPVSRIAHGGPRAMIETLYLSPTATQGSFQPIWFGYMWGKIVSGYSSRKLTFVEDTLTALSGIAGFMDAYSPGRYLAGVWEKDLHYQLCWTSFRDEGHRCFRPAEVVAPSFSWACRSGPVIFPFKWDIDYICHIVEMNCTLRTENPFGSVRDGFLKLKTRLISGIVRLNRHHFGQLERDKTLGYLQFDCAEDEELAQDQTVYCCELLHCAPNDYWMDGYEVVALILTPGPVEGAYRRIRLANDLPPRWFKDQPYTEPAIF